MLHYGLGIKPDFAAKTIRGRNTIAYRVAERAPKATMQILRKPWK